jgi:hypothetical protein
MINTIGVTIKFSDLQGIVSHRGLCLFKVAQLGLAYTGIENECVCDGIIPVYSQNGEICGICGMQKICRAILELYRACCGISRYAEQIELHRSRALHKRI